MRPTNRMAPGFGGPCPGWLPGGEKTLRRQAHQGELILPVNVVFTTHMRRMNVARAYKKKECVLCGKAFTPTSGTAKYCPYHSEMMKNPRRIVSRRRPYPPRPVRKPTRRLSAGHRRR